MATTQDIAAFRERWKGRGLQDWTDDEVACIVDVVDSRRHGEQFTDLCTLEGSVIETFQAAKTAGYAIVRLYVILPGQTPDEFAREVILDLVRRFPGRVAIDLYEQARRTALLESSQIYHAILANIHAGRIILSLEMTLLPAETEAISEASNVR